MRETTRAAELGIAALLGNVVGLLFTLVFTRVLGQEGYGSLAALLSTFLILTVPGYALQTTVAREISAAVAAGDPSAAGRGRGAPGWGAGGWGVGCAGCCGGRCSCPLSVSSRASRSPP